MANYRAVANGNWNSGATWGGGAVPPDAAGHNIYSNGFTVTIDQDVNVALITNAAITASFIGGGTSAAAGGGFSMPSAFNFTGNVVSSTATCLTISASTGIITMNGSSLSTGSTTSTNAVQLTGTATLNMTGYTCNSPSATFSNSVALTGNGTINLTSFITNGSGGAGTIYNITNSSTNGTINFYNSTINPITTTSVLNSSTGFITLTNCIVNGGGTNGIGISNNGTLSITGGNINAGNAGSAISSSNTLTVIGASINATNGASAISASGTVRVSGVFVNATNGQQAINSSRWILNTAPTNSYIQQALDGINSNSYVRFYTADNNLGQANPSDVRVGISYASGNLTGTLTVPARGTIASGVTYGPSMPFTATRSGTTATATLTYSYPYVVGDTITVTGASNTDWNGDYTIATVVSGTSVTFAVPSSISASAGTGARMQTKGTAVLDASAVASAVWGAATRTLTASLDPTVAQIRAELDSNSTRLANLDATVSSRLAPSGTLARVTLVDTATTLTNSPSVPSAASIASATRTELATELGRIDASVSSRLAASGYTAPTSAPTAAQNASAVRTELAVELARIDAATSTRATPANIPAADITAIKTKTDALNTTRLGQVATTEIVGNLLAQANS